MSRDTTVPTSARWLVAGALPLMLLSSLAPIARAQDADALFREGVTLREAGDSAGAVDRLRRAHRIDPAPRTTYNLAAALADRGRYVEAQLLLRHLVSSDEEDLLIHDAARELLERVTPRIALVSVEIVDGVPGQRVLIDGARGVDGAGELALDPGAHRIEVRSPEGTVLARSVVDLDPGERSTVVLRPVAGATIVANPEGTRAPGAQVPSTAVPASAARGDGETWMWVGISAGVVVVIGGVVAATAVALSSQSGATIDGDLPDVHVRGVP